MAWMFLDGNRPDSSISIFLAILAILLNGAYILFVLGRRGKSSLFDTLVIFISLPIVMWAIYFDTNSSDPIAKKFLVILAVSIPFGLLSWRDIRLHQKREALKREVVHWPSTGGTILESEVKVEPDGAYSSPHIVYEYFVDGIPYQSTLISLEEAFKSVSARSLASRKKTDNLVERFPKGDQISVYYNPSDHQQAIILPNDDLE